MWYSYIQAVSYSSIGFWVQVFRLLQCHEGEVQPRAHSSTVTVAYGGHPEECAGTAVAVLMSYTTLPSLTVSSEALVLLYLAHHPLWYHTGSPTWTAMLDHPRGRMTGQGSLVLTLDQSQASPRSSVGPGCKLWHSPTRHFWASGSRGANSTHRGTRNADQSRRQSHIPTQVRPWPPHRWNGTIGPAISYARCPASTLCLPTRIAN